MTNKSRDQLSYEYEQKYGNIPKEYVDRLSWLYDTFHVTPKKSEEIITKRDQMLLSLHYISFQVVLYEEPDGAKRPRFRLVNRKNLANMAIANPDFVHVYSPNAHADNIFMRRLIDDNEIYTLNNLVCTPCQMVIRTYHKIPKYYKVEDVFLAETGIIRPMSYPDWDNIGKKYSDMFNANIWLDDNLVIDGEVHKYYSVLPRVEIDIHYLNMLYTKQQYNSIVSRKDFRSDQNISYFNGG